MAENSTSFRIHFLTARQAEKGKGVGSVPEKFWEELKFEATTKHKWATFSEAYGRTVGFFVAREDLSAFELHEALRKSLPMEAILKAGAVHLDVNSLEKSDGVRVLEAVGNLFALSQYQPEKYGKKAGSLKPAKKPASAKNADAAATALEVSIRGEEGARLVKALKLGYAEGEAANLVRTLSELPGNELRPSTYLERVRKIADDLGLEVTFHDQAALKKIGAGSFLAVVRANPDEPYGIVKLHYKPKGAKKKLAIVGKGLCFDTGGYNIKVGEGMFDMHRDMAGSAVALALTKHLVESEAKVEIETYLALAENLISPSAYRPNDVVIASNGIAIEVVDTDAEGRMVLADTLVMASRGEPDLIIDYATLTGAVIRALGTTRSGVFSNDARATEVALRAGDETGERVWNFPIGGEYLTALESEVADLKQCGPGNYCDHIYAATFLSQFVEGNVPWVHVDLASESNKGGLGLSAREVTGFGVRLGKRIAESFLKF